MAQQQYFFKITATYSHKNNLYKEFFAFAKANDGTLLQNKKALKKFLKSFKEKLSELEKKHSRCKPLSFETYSFKIDDTHLHLSDRGSWRAAIYKVNISR